MIERTIFREEHEIFRQTVRRFVDREIVPFHAKWEEEQTVAGILVPLGGALTGTAQDDEVVRLACTLARQAKAPLSFLHVIQVPRTVCPVIDLPCTWEEYVRALQRKPRQHLESFARRVVEEMGARFQMVTQPADVPGGQPEKTSKQSPATKAQSIPSSVPRKMPQSTTQISTIPGKTPRKAK